MALSFGLEMLEQASNEIPLSGTPSLGSYMYLKMCTGLFAVTNACTWVLHLATCMHTSIRSFPTMLRFWINWYFKQCLQSLQSATNPKP